MLNLVKLNKNASDVFGKLKYIILKLVFYIVGDIILKLYIIIFGGFLFGV